ncbi:hypothetical protein AB3329_10470 [Streptococcus sp. H31]|uniref:hypothetical protein n=1 Tax=Streptococcus huangxiaojuni TaxID=3237239 RepID=UPI0034A4E7D1
MSVWEDITNAFEAGVEESAESLRTVEKNLEKTLIKTVYAAIKNGEKEKIIQKYDKEISDLAAETKTAMTTIIANMDDAIKGEWSKAIKKAVKTKSKAYDEL